MSNIEDVKDDLVMALQQHGDEAGPDDLSDPNLTNADRAERAEVGAEAYRVAAGFRQPLDVEFESVFQDCINDLCHAAHARDMHVEGLIACAYLSFRTEQANECESDESDESDDA